ncbi:hypothetical protein NXS19_012981 [Fusarium pseudograminearum]|nr:hypothetical protein NXS19_012981 [Fusarium pseudograminearum]
MDWANDNAICCQNEISRVFKYEERPTRVVRVFPGLREPLIRTMKDDKDWNTWFEEEHPKLDGSQSGLVLILARRGGESRINPVQRMQSSDCVRDIERVASGFKEAPKDALRGTGGQRTLRNIPFSAQTFKRIAKEFRIHDSIIRHVSRADVPDFSAIKLDMEQSNHQPLPAHVYNIRTSNSWENDLAASTTYLPHCSLSLSIVFGCTLSIEDEIMSRLTRVTYEISHPLLIPSIIVELERKRQLPIVEDMIDQVETKILELDKDPESLQDVPRDEKIALKEAKRSAWLDMLYLRNQLLSWRRCMETLHKQTKSLDRKMFGRPYAQFPYKYEGTEELDERDYSSSDSDSELEDYCNVRPSANNHCYKNVEHQGSRQLVRTEIEPYYPDSHKPPWTSSFYMRRTGKKIKGRLEQIMREYSDKIQQCTSGIEGMVMSTQWAQGETNVEIALATSQDSRHMRSIALVTMVFLPGTFFASIFSMGFFNFTGSGSVIVSRLFWLYVVLAVGFTAITVGRRRCPPLSVLKLLQSEKIA